MKFNDKKDNKIISVSLNQDSTCFSVGYDKGFKVFNTNPFKASLDRSIGGGIFIVEMLYRCNILALVGGGSNPKYPNNYVILWDDHQKQPITELKFNYEVKNVKLRRDKIVIVCEQKIFVFNFQMLQDIDNIDTFENPKGIVALSNDPKKTVLAFPADKTKGYVRVKCYEDQTTTLINAHESAISFLALNYDGSMLATSSDKGTLIRIFQSNTGQILQEVRRGKEMATINYICFNKTSQLLACSSNRKTIHIWSLMNAFKKIYHEDDSNNKSDDKDNEDKKGKKDYKENKDNNNNNNDNINNGKATNLPENNTSIFNGLSLFHKNSFFNSEWSFAKVRINEEVSICTFVEDNMIAIISPKGKYYKAQIDLVKGGECKIIDKFDF